ncbi:MAG: PrsW family glutamic-type intramembrane protease [Bacteroidia bacterium]|nr:PrsW family glutamic-type intramembrane protease [Bacteroidia bacterium]
MVYIIRNNQQFGPYDEQTLLSYVNSGQILLCDAAMDCNTGEESNVRYFIKKAGLKTNIPHGGNLIEQLKKIGKELIIPSDTFNKTKILSDARLVMLALIGLCPSVLMFLPIGGFLVFYCLSLYFAAIWGLFFYYFFKTPQVKAKSAIVVFFITQGAVFLLWDIFGLPQFNPFYQLLETSFPFSLVGFVLGVGLTEELGKAIPLFIIFRKAKEPLIPQTMVFYGLMSGIAFGVFEGVQYQMTVNAEQEYTTAYFLNILRLTSLPFIHAVWCGIAGYFISFANLYPKYRISLYCLAIAIPALLHGFYDTFCGSSLGALIALPIMFLAVILLSNYLKKGVNYQSKLRN